MVSSPCSFYSILSERNVTTLVYHNTLMKMFNVINIGERAGSGVPNIFNVWDNEGFVEPEIEERFDPDRTILTLSFLKKQAIKNKQRKRKKILK